MESFRKSSSGTQTEISAIRKKKDAVDGNSNSNSSNNNNNDAKYTAQYKKHTAPHKPGKYQNNFKGLRVYVGTRPLNILVTIDQDIYVS